MAHPNQDYPNYARSERFADGTIHVLGVSGAFIGAVLLAIWSFGQVSGGQSLALGIYAVALVATFSASALYHMTPWESARPTLRRFDHAAIYLKIAGTYSPLVVLIGSISSYSLLALVWALAVLGIVRKLFFWQAPGWLGTGLYMLMGWMSVAIIWALVPVLPLASIWLIATGGLLYSFGVIFFSWESLKYSIAIWHGFVLIGSACFYAAISLAFSGQTA
jgi:hemolysin III